MKRFLKIYVIALPVFLFIDFVWLGLIANNFYAKHIGFLMATQFNIFAALLFYLIFVVGLVIFVLSSVLVNKSWSELLFKSALFGLVTYATYDLTNLATIKDWPIIVTVVDLLWGVILSTLVSAITFLVIDKWKFK